MPAARRLMHLVVAAAVLAGVAARAQDRPIPTITPRNSPVVLDEGIFFLVGQLASVSVRNAHTSPVLVRVRAWAFDQHGQFKGTNGYCTGEWLDRGMRRVVSIPLEVPDLASTDTVVASVESVLADGVRWTVRESIADQLAAARARAASGSGMMTMVETEPEAPAAFCRCDCEEIARTCDAYCWEAGLRAFTCTPTATSGCSAACICR